MLYEVITLFGYGSKAKAVAKGLKQEGFHFHIIVSDDTKYQMAKDDGYLDITVLDITKDEALESLNATENDYFICVMEDEHVNVFLTLSLHALFPESYNFV